LQKYFIESKERITSKRHKLINGFRVPLPHQDRFNRIAYNHH
jgi:hypothetical protein